MKPILQKSVPESVWVSIIREICVKLAFILDPAAGDLDGGWRNCGEGILAVCAGGKPAAKAPLTASGQWRLSGLISP